LHRSNLEQDEVVDDEEEEAPAAMSSSESITLGPLSELEEDDQVVFDEGLWAADQIDSTDELPALRAPPAGSNVMLECPEESELTPVSCGGRTTARRATRGG
jgi:hypothetical protein